MKMEETPRALDKKLTVNNKSVGTKLYVIRPVGWKLRYIAMEKSTHSALKATKKVHTQ